MATLKLQNISKTFDDKNVLKNINLDVKDNEFCVLLGPSGCGKSTLLRIIAGLTHQNCGDVLIDNKNVNETEAKARDIAFVFQSYALYPHLTVFENIAFPLKIRHENKEEIKKKVDEALSLLDLTDFKDKRPKELSGGQRQRVALGRAIVRKPKIFLMDEPLSNLDAKLRSQMRFEIKKLQKKLGTTFIYVTHDQIEALTMGDKIVVLNEGEIQQQGSAKDVFNSPKNVFVAQFVGNLPMNIIDMKDKFLGFRPEDVKIGENGAISFKVFENYTEILGNEKLIHFKYNNSNCIIKTKIDTDVEKSTFCVDEDKIYYFNKENGARI